MNTYTLGIKSHFKVLFLFVQPLPLGSKTFSLPVRAAFLLKAWLLYQLRLGALPYLESQTSQTSCMCIYTVNKISRMTWFVSILKLETT